LESQFIGCWKGALCGLLLHKDDCVQLDRATAKVIAKFDKLNFNESRLKVSKCGFVECCAVTLISDVCYACFRSLCHVNYILKSDSPLASLA